MNNRQELNVALAALVERSAAIENDVRDIDHQIERAMHAVAAESDNVGHAMGVLTERRNVQLGHMSDLGKIARRLKTWKTDEQQQERQAVQEWETSAAAVQNRASDGMLDWLEIDTRPQTERAHEEPSLDRDHDRGQ